VVDPMNTDFDPPADVVVQRSRQEQLRTLGPFTLLGVSTALLLAIGIGATASGVMPERSSALSIGLGALTPARAVVLLVVLGAVGYALVPSENSRLLRAVFASAVVLAAGGLAVDAVFAPPATFGAQFEAEYEPSSNLTYGTELAEGVREGRGLTYPNGSVETYRMPGYPFFVALTGTIGGAPADDWLQVTQLTIWAQVFLTAAAAGLFAFVAAPRFGRLTLLAVVIGIALLPAGVRFTQVDSVVVALGLLVTTAILPFLDRARRWEIGWRYVILLHLAFATYFAFRTEVLFAWAAVSLIVHWGMWRRLLLPVGLFLAVAVSFGTYTATHDNEFSLGTNNLGHVAFVGLWEVPDHRFVWEPADASYDEWIIQHGHTYRRPGANAFAIREIARFYATYPGYVATMVNYKLFNYFEVHFAAGDSAEYLHELRSRFRAGMQRGGAWMLFGAVALALVVGYRRYQTALLAWGFLFTLPPFLLLQSEARFTRFVGVSLIIAAVPLVLDRGFWAALVRRLPVALSVALVLAAVWIVAGEPFDRSLLELEGFRYWTPILDPEGSTLSVTR
jgi:hypothetical protein